MDTLKNGLSTASTKVKGFGSTVYNAVKGDKRLQAGIVLGGLVAGGLGYKYLRDKRLQKEAAEREMIANDKLNKDMHSVEDKAAKAAGESKKPGFFSGVNLIIIVVIVLLLGSGAYYYTRG